MTDDTPDEPSDDARHGRRAVVAGLAGTGAGIAAYVAIHGVPGINGPDPPPSVPSDERRTASRPADAGGFANRDESYASSIEPISAIHEPPPTLVFPTAGEATTGAPGRAGQCADLRLVRRGVPSSVVPFMTSGGVWLLRKHLTVSAAGRRCVPLDRGARSGAGRDDHPTYPPSDPARTFDVAGFRTFCQVALLGTF